MFNEELGSPFIIVHSVSFVKSDKHSVAVLLLRVEKDELDTKGSGFHITLEWVTFVEMNKAGKCFTFMLLVRKGEKKKRKPNNNNNNTGKEKQLLCFHSLF